MAHKTLIARLADVKGATVCAVIGHRPELVEAVRLDLGSSIAHRHRSAYCRRCLCHVGD